MGSLRPVAQIESVPCASSVGAFATLGTFRDCGKKISRRDRAVEKKKSNRHDWKLAQCFSFFFLFLPWQRCLRIYYTSSRGRVIHLHSMVLSLLLCFQIFRNYSFHQSHIILGWLRHRQAYSASTIKVVLSWRWQWWLSCQRENEMFTVPFQFYVYSKHSHSCPRFLKRYLVGDAEDPCYARGGHLWSRTEGVLRFWQKPCPWPINVSRNCPVAALRVALSDFTACCARCRWRRRHFPILHIQFTTPLSSGLFNERL